MEIHALARRGWWKRSTGVLRRLGGSTRAWRTDRMATVVHLGTDHITSQFAQLAKHHGVQVWVCPARRPQRKVSSRPRCGIHPPLVGAHRASLEPLLAAQADLACPAADQRKRRNETIARLAAQEQLLALPASRSRRR